MKTSAISLLCVACLSVAIALPAQAKGIKQLISVSNEQATQANSAALEGAPKESRGMKQKSWNPANFNRAQVEGAAPPPADPSISHASRIVDDIDAIAAFESTASADGIDDAELKRLAELVVVAREHVDAAIAAVSTQTAEAKQQLKAATDVDDKEQLRLQLRSLRATVKAHRQTAATLKTLAKRLAA
jgi:hypothetical protein